MKQIFTKFADNFYQYDEKQNQSISLLEHVKKMVLDLMVASDDNFYKETNEKESRFIVSSESEADVTRTSEKYDLFKRIVDEYCSENGTLSRSCKKTKDAIEDVNEYRRYAKIYRKLETLFLERSERSESSKKRNESYARAMFCRVAQMTLRNGNSSSILERSFSDSLRSCSDRKVKKRNVFG